MKYVEFIKFDCIKTLGKPYTFCDKNSWEGPSCSRIPQPMPDYESLPEYHYKNVDSTPTSINGVTRPIDDFQPRKQIIEAFRKGEIKAVTSCSTHKIDQQETDG